MATPSAQYPFAAVLGCMDSRIPIELVFDQGIGDVFGVRVAGNVVNPIQEPARSSYRATAMVEGG